MIVASLLPGGVARRRGLVGAVVDDLHDLDEAEGGAEAAKGRLQFGVDLGHLAMMPAVSVAHSQRSDATRLLSGTLAAGEPAGGEYPSAAFGPLWGLLGAPGAGARPARNPGSLRSSGSSASPERGAVR